VGFGSKDQGLKALVSPVPAVGGENGAGCEQTKGGLGLGAGAALGLLAVTSTPTGSPVVLVVEDDAVNRKLLADICRTEGYEVVVAEDGEGALAEFSQRRFDLVLVDAAMPRKDGFEVCEAIRARSSVPVIMITASVEQKTQVRARQSGATGFMTKPFRIYELTRNIRAALSGRSASEPPTSTGRRQRRRAVANVLTGLAGAIELRARLRRESDCEGELRACLLVRLENESQMVEHEGRHASDAVLGLVGKALLKELGQEAVFLAESNEVVAVLSASKLQAATGVLGEIEAELGGLEVGEVVLRMGVAQYQAQIGLDVDRVLQAARAAVDRASRAGETLATETVALRGPVSSR
jgi:DNA-binding response OmpR family regulator